MSYLTVGGTFFFRDGDLSVPKFELFQYQAKKLAELMNSDAITVS